MKKSIILNPQTGEFEEISEGAVAGGSPSSPRRSMKRGGEAGAYDFSFVDSEKIKVFAVYPKEFEVLTLAREALVAQARALAEKARAFEAMGNDPKNLLSSEEMAGLEKKLRMETHTMTKGQNEMAESLVCACVVGWENASIPFSESSRAELPFEISVEWMRKILDQTELSQGEGDFLSSNSASGSPDTP